MAITYMSFSIFSQDDYILMTRIIAPNMKWPDSCQPSGTVFEMIDTVQDLHKQNDIGPVIVVDRWVYMFS